MTKKHWTVILVVLTVLGMMIYLSGCNGVGYINYQGKERPVTEVEEMLADYLEAENGEREFNVTITNDVD